MGKNDAVLITGCGNGLGLALVKNLSAKGVSVFAGVRELSHAVSFPAGVMPLLLDVTNDQHIQAAVNTVSTSGHVLKALVNNAGIHAGGAIECVSEAKSRRVFDVNFFGALAVTKAFLPLFREQKSGHIMMLSSLSGFVALPGDGIYAASKHALEAATESLAIEVAPWNITVTLLQPGAYATNLLRSPPPAGVYQAMLPVPETQGQTPGADNAAAEIAILIDTPPSNLRQPIGVQARSVVEAMASFSQGERRDFIIQASGTEPWIKGDP